VQETTVKSGSFRVEATFQKCDHDKAFELCKDIARLAKSYGLGCAVGMPKVNEDMHYKDCGAVGGGWPHPASAHDE
jgi:hypothetical protein